MKKSVQKRVFYFFITPVHWIICLLLAFHVSICWRNLSVCTLFNQNHVFFSRAGPNALSHQPTLFLTLKKEKQYISLILLQKTDIFQQKKNATKKVLSVTVMELEVSWPLASFVLCTGGQLFFIKMMLLCSWCLTISQRLCVNMSIQIKHIVCIYCLFTCIAC